MFAKNTKVRFFKKLKHCEKYKNSGGNQKTENGF